MYFLKRVMNIRTLNLDEDNLKVIKLILYDWIFKETKFLIEN
jgi:hypothetical protein